MSIFNISSLISKQYHNKIYIFFILNFLCLVLEMLSLGLIFPIILSIVSNSISDLDLIPSVYKFLNLDFNSKESLNYLLIFFLFFFIIKNLFLIYFRWWQYNLTNSITLNIQNSLLETYLNEKMENINTYNAGIKIRNIKQETSRFGKFLISYLTVFLESFIILGILSVLILTDVTLVIYIFIISVPIFCIFYYLAKKIALPISKRKLFISEKSMSLLNEALKFIKEIRLFKKTNLFLNNFKILEKESFDLTTKFQTYNVSPKLIIEIIIIALLTCTIFFIDINNVSSEKLTAFLGLLTVSAIRLHSSITRIIMSFNDIKHNQPSMEMLINESKKEKIISNQSNSFHKFQKSINFNNVTFSYSEKKPIFKNLDFSINLKDKILILAPSGQGKTTLLDLITGLIKPNNGMVMIDNYSTFEYFEKINDNFGYLSQESFILNDTIKFNICFEKDHKKIDNKKLDDALQISGLNQIDKNTDELLNFVVNENGSNLSGGQRQRISIARIVYKNPNILLFDEPTSQLDKESENLIIKNLIKYFEDKTMIFTTHSKEANKYFKKKYLLNNFDIKIDKIHD